MAPYNFIDALKTIMNKPDFQNILMQTSDPNYVSSPFEEGDYDYSGYRQKYGPIDMSNGKHLTDEFKKPSHITFSDQSIYSTPESQGGKWVQQGNQWHFYASPFNLSQHDAQALQQYFNTFEPNSVLHLPPAFPLNNPSK